MKTQNQTDKVTARLWTGRTPRQEIVETAKINCLVNPAMTAAMGLESVMPNIQDNPPVGSPKAEMIRYWNSISTDAQIRLVSDIRRIVKQDDKLQGRKITR